MTALLRCPDRTGNLLPKRSQTRPALREKVSVRAVGDSDGNVVGGNQRFRHAMVQDLAVAQRAKFNINEMSEML
jgi:hypothetical protein